MRQTDVVTTIRRFADACGELMNAELTVCETAVATLRSATPVVPGCCTVPDPCWMPYTLGEAASHVCAGESASVRLTIHNCDRVKRTYRVSAAGAGAARVRITPTTLVLGPKEHGCVTVTFKTPADCGCETIETLIWVRGCNEHYLRWSVVTGSRSAHACVEVAVEDCPDYVHHWYDHFYCHRPCFSRAADHKDHGNA